MLGGGIKSSELAAKHVAPCSKLPSDTNERGGHGPPGSCVCVVTSSLRRMWQIAGLWGNSVGFETRKNDI